MDLFETDIGPQPTEETRFGNSALPEDLPEADLSAPDAADVQPIIPPVIYTDSQPAADAQAAPIPAAEPDEIPAAAAAPVQNSYGTYQGSGVGQRENVRPQPSYTGSPYTADTYRPPVYSQPVYRSAPVYTPPQAPYQAPIAPNPPQVSEKKARKSGKFLRSAGAVLLTGILIAGSCFFTAKFMEHRMTIQQEQQNTTIDALNRRIDDLQNQLNSIPEPSTAVPGNTVNHTGQMTPTEVYAQNVNSVVGVASTVYASNAYGQTSQGTSTGSGFIITADGYIVTNYHVVEGGSSVTVTTHDGTEYPAKVVGYDAANDIAVLKVEGSGMPAVTLGSSEALNIGDMVVAIGNPLGQLTATQTVGYVSGKNREISTDSTIINMIQTDAAINSGNSGGPLFNMYGEVVGITSAKYSGTTSSGASIEGISFAIPIDDVMSIIGDLQNFGYVTGAYLGISVQNTDPSSAAMFGLPNGAYVVSIVPGASADRAGVQEKDIIIALGDYEVTTVTELTRTLRRFKAGDTTTITVIRSGQQLVLTITLDEKPQDLNTPAAQDPQMPDDGNFDEWYDYFRRYFGEE